MKLLLLLVIITLPMSLFSMNVKANAGTDTTRPEFPGGTAAWIKYLEKNVDPLLALNLNIKKRARSVKQTVLVSFIVDTTGEITDIGVINIAEVHPKLAEAAMEVVKNSPIWVPATYEGNKVRYPVKQSITWVAGE